MMESSQIQRQMSEMHEQSKISARSEMLGLKPCSQETAEAHKRLQKLRTDIRSSEQTAGVHITKTVWIDENRGEMHCEFLLKVSQSE